MRSALYARRRPRTVDPETLLGAALLAWWNADDLSDGAVASWVDRIGSYDVTQATGAAQPVRAADSLNGRPGVTFDGTDDFLTLTGVPVAFPVGTDSSEIFAALTQVVGAGTAGTKLAFGYGGSSNGNRQLGRVVSNSVNRFYLSDGSNALFATGLPDFSGLHVVAGRWDGATLFGRMDGAPIHVSGAASFNTTTTRVRFAGNLNVSTPTVFYGGVIRHVLVTSILTDQQRQSVEGWLAQDIGLLHKLPMHHPYRWAAQ